jgi:hypothetical protein
MNDPPTLYDACDRVSEEARQLFGTADLTVEWEIPPETRERVVASLRKAAAACSRFPAYIPATTRAIALSVNRLLMAEMAEVDLSNKPIPPVMAEMAEVDLSNKPIPPDPERRQLGYHDWHGDRRDRHELKRRHFQRPHRPTDHRVQRRGK